MQCYSELLPPTGVTHSLPLSFISANATNLVIARTSVLQIFELRTQDILEETKLVLLAEYALQGTISALAKVNLVKSKSGGDALLVAFRDAKLSLIEWDPAQHSISTISIHYYENHDLLLCPWSPDLQDCVSHLTVDPSSRCAAFNFNVNSLAIIPFHQANDDLAMDDDPFDDSDDDGTDGSAPKPTNGDTSRDEKLYAPSFVLPMTALDPSLLHPLAMTFLHEYREPTIGVLFSHLAASMNMAPERRDVLQYAVYTLDVDQKASTTLLSVAKLPNDLHQVVAVPAPIGGTLLIGGNEIIHVDQGGRSNAVGVNEFSKEASSFPMADQSNLQLRLEGCKAQRLSANNSNVLLILSNGSFAVVSFRVDGRSVSGLLVQTIDRSWTSSIFESRCSTIADLGNGNIFIGSEEADSVLISTVKQMSQLKRTTSRSYLDDTNGQIDLDEDEDEDDDDDDLYADTNANSSLQQGSLDGSSIVLKDTLHSLAPINDIVLGQSLARKPEDEDDVEPTISKLEHLELVASCHKGSKGSLAFLSRSLTPRIVKKHRLRRGTCVWALSSELSELDSDARPFDDILVVTYDSVSAPQQTLLLDLSLTVEDKEAADFEKGDRAVATGRLATGSHVVVYTRDVRAYDREFGLDQIFAIVDDDADATAEALTASVTDTHILILKTDHTIMLLKVDKSGDLDEIDLPDIVPSENIQSACLYEDIHDFFGSKRYSPDVSAKSLVLAILTHDGSFSLHPVSNLSVQIFQFAGLHFLPSQLSLDSQIPKHWRNTDELLDMSLCTLGPNLYGKPYLVLRNSAADVTIYEPFQVHNVEGAYRFMKLSCHNGDAREAYNDKGEDLSDALLRPSLIPLADVNGASVLFVTGRFPRLVSKSAAGLPRAHRLDTGPISQISGFHDSSVNRGFVYVSSDNELVFGEIPTEANLDQPDWISRKVEIGEDVSGLAFYPRTGSYVLATSVPAPFNLPRDDEWHAEWAEDHEKATPNFLPTTQSCSLKLISSTTHSIISQYHFSEDEEVLSIKCLSIEVSEVTHERKDLIVVGTGIARGENVVTRGYIYLFDVVDVVPHPEIPETDLRLKLITREDVRGAVTALSGIGNQGFLLAAQGQKCMVRGLREDNAILPVAFMDMRYYVSVAKELAGTGLTILADAFAGLWLIGYSEEPYKMQLLSRDLTNPSVVAAEFLPQDKQLYIVASDGNGDLRILQYDPEIARTERGSMLLHRSTFNIGYYPTLMSLLPRTSTPSEALVVSSSAMKNGDLDSDDEMEPQDTVQQPGHHILIATREGALALVTPLSEQQYRRLSTLQTTLTAQLDQACGLNPRAHRQVETDGVGGRPIIDGQMARRWLEQSSQHKYALADRAGGTVWDIRSDLEAISGAGLGYL